MKFTAAFRCLFAAAGAAFVLMAPPARGTLLSAGFEIQLEAWLGQGDLDFANLFTKTTGSTTIDFHADADGQGATFVLMSIAGRGAYGLFDLPGQIIGGYNPQSWNSSSGYNQTPTNADRTAFRYNVSTSTIQRQNLVGQGFGQFQSYNHAVYGPSFGAGLDLHVGFGGGGSVTNLDYGYAHNYSYGGTSNGDDIVFGGPNRGIYSYFDVLELEVYGFSPAQGNVPDTAGTLGLLGFALLGLIVSRRRRAQTA